MYGRCGRPRSHSGTGQRLLDGRGARASRQQQRQLPPPADQRRAASRVAYPLHPLDYRNSRSSRWDDGLERSAWPGASSSARCFCRWRDYRSQSGVTAGATGRRAIGGPPPLSLRSLLAPLAAPPLVQRASRRTRQRRSLWSSSSATPLAPAAAVHPACRGCGADSLSGQRSGRYPLPAAKGSAASPPREPRRRLCTATGSRPAIGAAARRGLPATCSLSAPSCWLPAAVAARRSMRLYDALGISPDADDKAIKKAYKKQAL
jgi:hypothetical protein